MLPLVSESISSRASQTISNPAPPANCTRPWRRRAEWRRRPISMLSFATSRQPGLQPRHLGSSSSSGARSWPSSSEHSKQPSVKGSNGNPYANGENPKYGEIAKLEPEKEAARPGTEGSDLIFGALGLLRACVGGDANPGPQSSVNGCHAQKMYLKTWEPRQKRQGLAGHNAQPGVCVPRARGRRRLPPRQENRGKNPRFVSFREPGARRRLGMCKDVLVRRFLLAAGLLPKNP